MALKIIFMGTPSFAVPILESILNSHHHLLAVYTQNPKKSDRGQKIKISPIHYFAKKKKIEVRSPQNLDKEEMMFIQNLNPDIIVVVAYGKIIPPEYLKIKNVKFINIHASLLPKWRGAAPIQRSLMEIDEETGISIMKIIQKLDAGPLILQEKIKIKKNDNYHSLSAKLANLGSRLIIKSLNLLETNNFKLIDQDETKATYANKIDKKEAKIDWNIPAKKLIAKINGLSPFPGAWFEHKKTRIKILEAAEVEQTGETGEILDDNLTIACKEKAIQVLSVQKEGKKILKTKEFLSGYSVRKGEKLF
ncbi:MAG: methionyl-tRNA formyltransferase [Pseudomonadota bacterium]|nr:methionyl-tRNA formyltransferase [Pseudomonadota bacterium]